MKIILLLIFPFLLARGQEQEIIRVHRDPHTGKIWKKPPHQSLKSKASRLSLSYQMKLSNDSSGKLQTIEGSYAYRREKIWPEVFASLTTGTLRSLSSGSDPSHRPVTLSLFGLGLSHQSHFIQKFLKMPNSYESVAAGLGLYTLQEGRQGPGLKTDFKTLLHSSNNLHYGLKFSYHLVHLFDASPVKIFSWLTIGFDIGYYF